MSHVVVLLSLLIEIKERKTRKKKKEKKGKKGRGASIADFVICLLAYESGFFFNFCLPDHLLEGRKEGELKHFGSYHVKLDASRHVSKQ